MNKPPAGSPTGTSRPPVLTAAPRRRGRSTAIIVISAVVILLAAVWYINHRKVEQMGGPGGRAARMARGFGPNMPLPVGTALVAKSDIPIYLNALGTVTPTNVAVIRTQISGQLQEIAFQEGQYVKKGDPLAVIDPRPYQNALAQAQAQLVQAQAQLHIQEADLKRYQTLAQQDSISQQQVESTQAQLSQAHGLVQSAEAAIATAKLNLNYCHINAPFDGRVGLRQVDVGNYLTPGDTNGIVVLTQTHPITVLFTLPEDNMAAVAQRLRRGAKLPVDVYNRDDTQKIASGVLASMDNQIDATTGTFKLRADFSNEDEALFPNQFVNVRLLLDTIHDAPVIPTSAVERGPNGPFAYVVTPEDTAAPRDIKLGQSAGERVIVTDGLQVGDRVVTDGADRLKEGQKVILTDETGRGTPPATEARPAGGWKGEGGGNWKGQAGGKKWNGQRHPGGPNGAAKE